MYGLVLEGGGAKGAYHVGAYKALKELNIEIKGIAGTSIGALNAAAFIQGDIEALEDIWINTKSSDLFNIDEKALDDLKNFNLENVNLPYLLNVSKEILVNRGLDISKIRELLENFIDEDKIRNSDLDFGIVTVNLTDKKPMELLKEEIPQGKMVDYILASANLPTFKQEEMDGKFFLDGGFHDNLPIGILSRKGYKDFIAVRTFAIGRIKKHDKKKLNVINIEPVESLGSLLDFNKKQAEKDMSLGYYDTMKVFKNLKGYKYYIEKYDDDFVKYMLDFLMNSEDIIINIGNVLGFENLPSHRMLFEKIMPHVEAMLDMKGNYDYQDIVIRLIEKIAEKYDESHEKNELKKADSIERFKIYNFEEFIQLVVEKFKNKPIPYNKSIPTFIKKNKILSLPVKESILIELFVEIFIDQKNHK